jgi:heme ABC exporter ATP-binding subunit CcmA
MKARPSTVKIFSTTIHPRYRQWWVLAAPSQFVVEGPGQYDVVVVSAPAIRLRSVVALAGRFPVLAGVDLDVEDGEVVLLEGSNGAGKTSLLRLLAGLLSVTEGEAEVLGFDLVADRKAVRPYVGILGHDPFVYDDLTIEENVRFFVEISGAEIDRVGPSLERFGLDGRLSSTPAGRASQGQRRRIALAMLVARSPRLWLLDEPHAGLDAATRAQLDVVMAEAAAAGCTVLYSSHEAERSRASEHRVVRVEGGQVVVSIEEQGGHHVA